MYTTILVGDYTLFTALVNTAIFISFSKIAEHELSISPCIVHLGFLLSAFFF